MLLLSALTLILHVPFIMFIKPAELVELTNVALCI